MNVGRLWLFLVGFYLKLEAFSYSSPEFIDFSIHSPTQKYFDPVNNVNWDYRDVGDTSLKESILIIPGIAETTNTMFRIVPSLLEVVGRVVIVSIPSYEKLSHFLVGFDVFTAKFQISQIHLIGFGLGGFLSLHISTYPNLSAEIKSLTLVSSYVSTVDFRNAGFLKFFTGKTRIFKDLSLDSAPDHLVNSYAFIAKEIEIIPASLISSRLTLRATSPNISISKIPQNPILIIQTLDFPLNISNSALPQQALGSMASVCLLKIGGCFPHLADPENLISCIKRHLQKIVGEK